MLSLTPRPEGRVHVVGAGPVGLFLAALLQSVDGYTVRLYERRPEYTRTRMVSLAPYLIADSVESYEADMLDWQNVEAIFEPTELETRMAYRRSVDADLRSLLQDWTRGFIALKTIEGSLSELIDARGTGTVERIAGEVSADQALAMVEPGDILVDCTGTRSVLRDLLVPGEDLDASGRNTTGVRLEYALVVTFLYDQHYDCNEYCKYYKNVENPEYKFIPAVHRTFYDGSISHVTGIITISQAEFEAMPRSFDGAWLRDNFPSVAASMDRFIDKIREETHGEVVRRSRDRPNPARRLSRQERDEPGLAQVGHRPPAGRTPVFLLGDSAIGSPYFQSISLGLECAFFLAGHIANRDLSFDEMFDRYESFMYRQWLRVYMRTQTIHHNKELLQSVGDDLGLLAKLHVY